MQSTFTWLPHDDGEAEQLLRGVEAFAAVRRDELTRLSHVLSVNLGPVTLSDAEGRRHRSEPEASACS